MSIGGGYSELRRRVNFIAVRISFSAWADIEVRNASVSG